MSMKISKKKKPPKVLPTLAEAGLLAHILESLRADGTFQQYNNEIADQYLSTEGSVRRYLKGLDHKGFLTIVAASYRGPDGWMIPPVWKPTGKMPWRQAYVTCDAGNLPTSPVTREHSNAKNTKNGDVGHVIEKATTYPTSRKSKPTSNDEQKHSYIENPLSPTGSIQEQQSSSAPERTGKKIRLRIPERDAKGRWVVDEEGL